MPYFRARRLSDAEADQPSPCASPARRADGARLAQGARCSAARPRRQQAHLRSRPRPPPRPRAPRRALARRPPRPAGRRRQLPRRRMQLRGALRGRRLTELPRRSRQICLGLRNCLLFDGHLRLGRSTLLISPAQPASPTAASTTPTTAAARNPSILAASVCSRTSQSPTRRALIRACGQRSSRSSRP